MCGLNVPKKKNRLKIAMIGQKKVPSRSGGIEVVLTELCPLLVKKGHEVTCYNRSNEKGEVLLDNQYKGVRMRKVWTINKNGLSAVSSSVLAALLAAFGKYDIVHFHAEGPAAALWIPKMFGKKCIVTIHGLDWKRDKWKNSFGTKYIKFGEKIAAKYADSIIVLSKSVQEYFKKEYNLDTVFIPNGVSNVETRNADIITEKFGLKKDDYFCSISRLTEEKEILSIIQAYKKLDTDKKLVIAGDDSKDTPYILKLKDCAKNNENIIFTGFVEGRELEELYSNAFAYILASNLEGMPLSLLEAMAYGNAVIGSDIPEIVDVIDGCGLVFQTGNVDQLSEQMNKLLKDKKLVTKLREDAFNLSQNKYDWDKIADQTVELYYNEKGRLL